ncbi:hypothetical protein SIID45300_03249 [Candidatus Magnetaquicoccaceae bacterium FCR-1]|uniref:Prepilin-type N-terminal cleavage/methylation domain-containing protein n=1 Tax=Candidatus Magnetaquiglobus chichijimensis TaxID=3141448 RepID=A0ABQ0CDD2_9PROT
MTTWHRLKSDSNPLPEADRHPGWPNRARTFGTRQDQRHQAGFTLLELMISSALSLIIGLVLWQLLGMILNIAQESGNLMALNQESRNLFQLLSEGGIASDDTRIPGYWGRSVDPASDNALRVTDYRLHLGLEAGPNLASGEWHPLDIPCQSAGNPLTACTAALETIRVTGYVAGLTTDNSRTVNNKTTEIQFNLVVPGALPILATTVPRWSYQTGFWTTLSLGVDP